MRNSRQVRVTALVFLAPTIIGLLAFRLIPIFWSFGLSFYDWKIFDKPEFAGLANYAHILSSPTAAKIFINTAYFSAIYVPGSVCLVPYPSFWH